MSGRTIIFLSLLTTALMIGGLVFMIVPDSGAGLGYSTGETRTLGVFGFGLGLLAKFALGAWVAARYLRQRDGDK